MNYTDPYFTVQDEVVKNLDIARLIYDEWRSAESSRTLSDLSDNLKQVLRSIEWDLEDIQETIGIVENNPSRFQLSEVDVSARHQFLRETREVVKAVKSQLELDGPKRNVQRASIQFTVSVPKPPVSNNSLANGTGPNKNMSESHVSLHAPIPETRNTRPTVFPVSSDPLSEQNDLLRHQDDRLDQLGTSISKLKGMSRQIGDELEDQVALLGDFSDEMAQTDSRLDAVTKRTARLLHLSTDRRQWLAIGGLSLTLLFIIILLIVL